MGNYSFPTSFYFMDAKIGTLDRGEISEKSQWDLSGLYSSHE